MIFERKIGSKGQVVIPRDIRDLFNMKPGSKILFKVDGNEITIRIAKDEKDFLKDFFKTPKKLTEKIDFKRIYDEQYDWG